MFFFQEAANTGIIFCFTEFKKVFGRIKQCHIAPLVSTSKSIKALYLYVEAAPHSSSLDVLTTFYAGVAPQLLIGWLLPLLHGAAAAVRKEEWAVA